MKAPSPPLYTIYSNMDENGLVIITIKYFFFTYLVICLIDVSFDLKTINSKAVTLKSQNLEFDKISKPR